MAAKLVRTNTPGIYRRHATTCERNGRCDCSLSVHASLVKRESGFVGWTARRSGGAWARSGRRMWCARAPSLISVHDPG
jgi:hypothetical protein